MLLSANSLTASWVCSHRYSLKGEYIGLKKIKDEFLLGARTRVVEGVLSKWNEINLCEDISISQQPATNYV